MLGQAGAPSVAFLFGAGASYAAGKVGNNVSPSVPPLASDLYDALASVFPGEWGRESRMAASADELRQNFEQAFEGLMPQSASPLTQIEHLIAIASFFRRFSLVAGGNDLYSKLVVGLRNLKVLDRTVLGSLNYDVLLEQACEQEKALVDYRLDEANARLQAQRTPPRRAGSAVITKLHGSCNFAGDLRGDARKLEGLLAQPGMHVEMSITAVPPSRCLTMSDDWRLDGPPIMCAIQERKEHLLSPAHLTQIRGIWGDAVMSADLAVVIGARPNRHDRHVWGPLKQTGGRRLYIGARSDYKTLSADPMSYGEGWTQVAERWEEVDTILAAVREACC